MFRLAMLLKYAYMIDDVRITMVTAQRLASPFLGILFAFYLITYEYQVIG